MLDTPFDEWPEGALVGLLRALANCVPSAQLAVSRISDDRLAGLIETLKQAVEPWRIGTPTPVKAVLEFCCGKG